MRKLISTRMASYRFKMAVLTAASYSGLDRRLTIYLNSREAKAKRQSSHVKKSACLQILKAWNRARHVPLLRRLLAASVLKEPQSHSDAASGVSATARGTNC